MHTKYNALIKLCHKLKHKLNALDIARAKVSDDFWTAVNTGEAAR